MPEPKPARAAPPTQPKRRRWLVAGLTLGILAGVVVAGYRWRNQKDGFPPAGEPHVLSDSAVTIVPGIHLLGGLEPAAAYVVETSDGLVLIDTGLRADLVKREMLALKLDWRRVRAIFLTHVHGDHSGGAQELRAATGAKIYAGRGDAAVLRAGRPREAYFSTFYMPVETPRSTTVDVELEGEQAIPIGDARFTALASPGHTPGSVCYLLERGGQRVLFSGDVIWSLSDEKYPLGTYSTYLSPRYRGDAAAFLTTLRRLRAMPAPALVLPGHPRNDSTPQSPVMTEQRWAELLDPGIRAMEQLQARYARDGADFLDGTAKKLHADLYYLGDFHNVAVYGFFAASKLFLVNAPGRRGLSAFVEDGLHKLELPRTTPAAVLLTSGDDEATEGVIELVEKWHPRIVAPSAAWEKLRKLCPPGVRLLTPEDLPGEKWFAVTPIALRGRGMGACAYLLPWGGKTVLFSGPIPIKPGRESATSLAKDLARRREDVPDYRASLRRLQDVSPNVWLPASPLNGQNANLYDEDWRDILTGNEQLFR
jgi:glyoxylase-like metal-dependent hydrolase (beta-lactamase superfamily II)